MVFICGKGCMSRIYKELWEINKQKVNIPTEQAIIDKEIQVANGVWQRYSTEECRLKHFTQDFVKNQTVHQNQVMAEHKIPLHVRDCQLEIPLCRTLRQNQVWRQAPQDPRFHSRVYTISRPRPTGQIWEIRFYWNTAPPLVIILSMATFTLQRQRGIAATVVICLTKPKQFTLRPLIQDTFANPALDRCFSNLNVHVDLLGTLWKCRLWFSHLWGGWESSFLTSSRVMMTPLVLGPRFDSQEAR